MRARFVRTLSVALVSYTVAIPLIYVFIAKVYGLGAGFALVCVGLAVLLTAPVLAVQALRTYKVPSEVSVTGSSDGPAARRTGLVGIVATLTLGVGAAVMGIVALLGDRPLLGAAVATFGAITVAALTFRLIKGTGTRNAAEESQRG